MNAIQSKKRRKEQRKEKIIKIVSGVLDTISRLTAPKKRFADKYKDSYKRDSYYVDERDSYYTDTHDSFYRDQYRDKSHTFSEETSYADEYLDNTAFWRGDDIKIENRRIKEILDGPIRDASSHWDSYNDSYYHDNYNDRYDDYGDSYYHDEYRDSYAEDKPKQKIKK